TASKLSKSAASSAGRSASAVRACVGLAMTRLRFIRKMWPASLCINVMNRIGHDEIRQIVETVHCGRVEVRLDVCDQSIGQCSCGHFRIRNDQAESLKVVHESVKISLIHTGFNESGRTCAGHEGAPKSTSGSIKAKILSIGQ